MKRRNLVSESKARTLANVRLVLMYTVHYKCKQVA